MTASSLLAPERTGPSPRLVPRVSVRDRCPVGRAVGSDDLEPWARRLAAEFRSRFGADPAAVAAAPATVSLLGGPSGLRIGPALVATVDRHALAAVRLGADGTVDVLTDRDFPSGAGLGSRAAERSALRLALAVLGREDRLPLSAGEVASRAGGPDVVVVVDAADHLDHRLAVDLPGAGLSLLSLDTGARPLTAGGALEARRRVLGLGTGPGAARMADVTPARLTALTVAGDPVASRCARHVLGEHSRVAAGMQALVARDVEALGRLMAASHVSLSQDLRTSTRQIDRMVQVADAAGAVGARMTGAGFGGSVLVLTPVELEDDVIGAVREAAAEAGFTPPRPLPLSIAGHARLLRR